MDQLSIIVPCYNEEQTVELFYTEVEKMVQYMPDIQTDYLFVDDGSTDRTLEKVKELHVRDKRVKYISFSRNFGKEAAMYAGLEHVSGEYAVIMDADLQDPPMLLPEMLRIIREEQYDSVATRRVTRKGEPPIRSFCARQFYHIMNKISDVELMDGARDYRFMTRKYVNAVLSLKEFNRFSKGILDGLDFGQNGLNSKIRSAVPGRQNGLFGNWYNIHCRELFHSRKHHSIWPPFLAEECAV